MIFDPDTSAHLKPWLVRTLEPICDAEPGALADYILALLKHNVPESEMRKELLSQLEEFLEKEGPSFIDTLFTVLRTKSYLPYSATSSTSGYSQPSASTPDAGIPIPLDALLSPTSPTPASERGLKRSNENDDRDGRPPAKGPRLNTDGQFSRYSDRRGGGPAGHSTGGWGGLGNQGGRPHMNENGHGGGGNMLMSRGMNGGMAQMNPRPPQNYQPPETKRSICRDYHHNGYCARGAFCRFSHGDDAVVPSQLYAMNNNPMGVAGMPFLPMFVPGPMPFPMAGPGVAYDPHEARMDMRPPTLSMGPGGRSGHRVPIMPRMNPEAANMIVQDGGELPVIQDLTPAALPDEAIAVNIAQDQFDVGNGNNYPPVTNMQMGGQMPVNGSLDVDMMPPPALPAHPTGKLRSPARPERTRGTFGGDANSLRPDRRNDTTLVVEKIPEDSLSLESINAWFKRFGAVTKVAIDPRNAKALVSFSDHKEAHAAWKSQEAVFNNRFVKLFWHRPMEGHGQTGARMLAASAPLVANMAAKEKAATSVSTSSQEPANAGNAAAKPTPPRKTPASSTLPATALAAKKELLDRQIAEQKALMVSYESASPEEKKRIIARHRELGEEMKAASSSAPVQTPAKTPAPAAQLPSDRERQERERLDKELEMHAAATPAGDSTSDLQAKLATLKAEAASLGLPDTSLQPSYGATYRPHRGRARGGRGFSYRGGMMRGGLARASMTLDNRPKKLLVKGVVEDGLQALRDWYETIGQMESVEKQAGGDVVVTFKSRNAAEQALAKGQSIPSVGQVSVTWWTGGHPPSSAPIDVHSPGSLPTVATDPMNYDTRTRSERVASPIHGPEEEISSGWGGYGDDGDGDGMGLL